MKRFANNIVMSPRECVYFAAVMLLLLPPEPSAMKDITGWMTFLVVFLMLFAAVVAMFRDKTIFLWDKIMFVTVSVFSMVATGITMFFRNDRNSAYYGSHFRLLGVPVYVGDRRSIYGVAKEKLVFTGTFRRSYPFLVFQQHCQSLTDVSSISFISIIAL